MVQRLLCVGGLGTAIIVGALAWGGHTPPAKAMKIAPRSHKRPVWIHRQRDATTSETYNWSGYAVTGATGSVTDVKTSWVVPSVNCSVAPNGYSAFWVGVDGWNSSTVEQIGTDSDCVNLLGTQAGAPTYYAWFEFYPQNAYLIGLYTDLGVCKSDCVYPGDVISAEVSSGAEPSPHDGPRFTVTITDLTRNWSFTTSSFVPGALQSSAEWIAETPFGCATDSGFCPLPDFGVAKFGGKFTGVSSTSVATVSGKTGAIGSFGDSVQQAIMVNYPSGTTVMAQPSALLDARTSFTVNWNSAGP